MDLEHVNQWRETFTLHALYEYRSINKLQNSVILLVFKYKESEKYVL